MRNTVAIFRIITSDGIKYNTKCKIEWVLNLGISGIAGSFKTLPFGFHAIV